MANSQEPPIVEVRNPVTYLRRWWDKVMGKEGIDFSFRIHPVTAVLSSAIIATIGFGAGRFVLPETVKIPFFEFDNNGNTPTTTPTIEWKETAYTGKLQYSVNSQKYFLLTTSSEAITLEVDANLDLLTLVGKRIFAVGEYSKQLRTLKVKDVKNLEVLPTTPIPIPTLESVPTQKPTVTDEPDLINDSTQGGELN